MEQQIPVDWYRVLFRWSNEMGLYVCDKIYWQDEAKSTSKKHYVREMPDKDVAGGVLHVGDPLPAAYLPSATSYTG